LLLAAATLKFRDSSWEPFGQLLLVPHRVRSLLIEIEAVVGLWLLSGLALALLRPVAATYFAALAAVSLVLAANGAPSCGCFGQTSVSPWVTAGVDLAALAALVAVRPPGRCAGDRAGYAVAGWTAVGLALLLGGEVVRQGGPAAAWAALADGPLTAVPAQVDLGDVAADEPHFARVTLVNSGDREVRVVGGTRNCASDATVDLPVTVPPGGEAAIRVLLKPRGRTGRFRSEYQLYVDDRAYRTVRGRVAGHLR
jgi:hypothetical protein